LNCIERNFIIIFVTVINLYHYLLSDYAQLGQRMRRVTQIVREMREMRDDEQAAPAAADNEQAAAAANPEEGTDRACVPASRTSSKLKSCCSLSSSFLVSLNP
jgi:hypothetical protein